MKVNLIDQFPQHLVVEFIDVDIPAIDLSSSGTKYTELEHYTNENNEHKRYVVELEYPLSRAMDEIKLCFRNLINVHIIPLIRSDYRFLSLVKDIQNSDNMFQICHDEAGWSQDIHVDSATHNIFMSGVIHITDTDSPTCFFNNRAGEVLQYTAPSKARSGAFWLNLPTSWHSVPVGLLDRNHIITFVTPPKEES